MSTPLPRQGTRIRRPPPAAQPREAGRPAAVPAPVAGHDLDRVAAPVLGWVITAGDGDYDSGPFGLLERRHRRSTRR